ncbi:hypothetical protein VNI00_012288 [Paramarasmius palmivorus]|uniref:VWFA domain-containing protein n=1 Tax=Paramarasmius palmivorus TaxID=297713 RepID=A0AAW0C6S4_9AGAR
MGASSSKVSEDLLQQLKSFDTVIILDDSGSMQGSRWKQVRGRPTMLNRNWTDILQAGKALTKLAPLAAEYDDDGVELHFLNHAEVYGSLTSKSQVEEIFNSVVPFGGTPIGRKLRGLLGDYIARYEKDENIKPVIFLLITDGAPTDPLPDNETKRVIIEFASKLDSMNARLSQVGIQFLQVGDDDAATRFLTSLDDDLKKEHGVRDMVDTTPSEKGKSLDVVKALLGAINRRVDNKGSKLT